MLLIFLGIKRHHPYQRPLLLASSAVLAFPFGMFFVIFFEDVSFSNYIAINFDRAVFPAAVFLLLTGLIMRFAESGQRNHSENLEG